MADISSAISSTDYRTWDESSLFMPRARSTELGKNEFITLLVKQMENQNPLEPMKDQEFIAQLATFSSLEQLIDLNKRIDGLSSGQDQLINSQALELIGREIVADTNGAVRVTGAGADRMIVDFDKAPVAARIEIYKTDGTLVGEIPIESPAAGRNEVDWQGYVNGQKLPEGDYKFKVMASDGKTTSAVDGYVSLVVDGIQVGANGMSLVSGDRSVSFANVIEIRRGPQAQQVASGGSRSFGQPALY